MDDWKNIEIENFNLKHTITCGQFFLYRKYDGCYYVNTRNPFCVFKRNNNLFFKGITKNRISNFFRFDDDYSEILDTLCKDRFVEKAVEKYSGLRLIRQDPWECTFTFICSTQSNVPRIRNLSYSVAKEFGKRKNVNGRSLNIFPDSNFCGDEEKFRELGAGYRANYLDGVSKLNRKFFQSLKNLDENEAREKLKTIKGIGNKVANCILLFSLDFLNCVPVDVWIKRVVGKIYLDDDDPSETDVIDCLQDMFSPYAGYAQQFIYHYARNSKIKF